MASKDFTVGQRIVLGFGIVLALLLFLGVAAFWGVTGIVNNGQEVIGGNQLDGDLAQKEVDHLVWANKVGSLLTDDKVEGLEVQLDPHQCGFGKWLYGEGRKQAVAQMPSLQSLLVQIEKPHQELHQSAGKIQEAFRRPHQGLDVILANRLADHLHWSATVSRELAEEAGGMYTLQNRIEEAVEVAWGVVSSIEKDPLAGGHQEKELLAQNILSAIRFGPDQKDYIYVLDADCRMIVHPNAALIGQDMCRDKDPEKAQIFKSMMKIAQDSGQGFIAYRWPEPGRELPRPKIASIKAFSPFGWVLGSGLYLDEDNTRLMYRFKQLQEQLPFTLSVQLDPGQCGLGLFLKDPETVRVMDRFPELKQAMTALENPHRRLHESAKTIEKAINDFDIPKALDVYEHQTLPALAEVEDQLAKAIKAEGALQQGYDRARAIYVQETVPALHKVQALLLDLRQEARRNVMSDQVMIDSGQTTQVGVLVIGGIALVLGVVLAWLISRSLIRRLAVVAEAIEANSEQVALAAGEISHASQDLADGASAQAASLEESSSSLEQMSSMTRQNADHADKADQLVAETARMMLQAESSMEEMNQSMDEIAASGRQIGKIIQTIDEIAFQTNLLALNAAVEAARAGEAGSGFAVVADEVRNLAQRAAEAAKNTSGLIESTVQKIDLGGRQVREAKETFEHAAANSKKMEELVGQIAAASKEQSQGVGQISDAVNQMDQITQRNAAAAEESAGASVELRSQAENLSDLVGGLMALVGRTQSEFQNATKRLAGGSRPQALEHRPSKAGHPGTKASIPWDREEE